LSAARLDSTLIPESNEPEMFVSEMTEYFILRTDAACEKHDHLLSGFLVILEELIKDPVKSCEEEKASEVFIGNIRVGYRLHSHPNIVISENAIDSLKERLHVTVIARKLRGDFSREK
jgi:hypothetical protein